MPIRFKEMLLLHFFFYKHRVGKMPQNYQERNGMRELTYNILVNKSPKTSAEMNLGKEIKEVRYI